MLHPTETLYGIGGAAWSSKAAVAVAERKQRPRLPLIVLVADTPAGLPPLARRLAHRFWPGPVTLVVPAAPLGLDLAPELVAADGTVGLRATSHPVARALVLAAGPITSTSANLHGRPPVQRPEQLEVEVEAILDVGPLAPSPPSTVVDGRSGVVLRAGAQLEAVIEEVGR